MEIKTLIYIVLTLILLSSCLNMNDPKDQAQYIQTRKSFDSTLVRFLPRKLPNNQIGYSWSSPEYFSENNEYAGMNVSTRFSSREEYLKVKLQYIRKAMYVKNSSDSCLLVIKTFGLLKKDYYNADKCGKLLPVSQDAVCAYNEIDSKWTRLKKTDIIILDYKLGDFRHRKDKSENVNLPKGYTEGYSTGISANDKDLTIQYWLIIW